MLALLKNHLNYIKGSIFECFIKDHNRLFFFFLKTFFLQHIMVESLSLEEESIIKESLSLDKESIIKDITNHFRLKKLNSTAIKDIRNLFRLQKETQGIKD